MIPKKCAYLSILLSLMILSGCSGSGEENSTTERIPVEVSPVELGSLEQSLSYNGDVEAECEVRVFSKVPDRIEKLYVDESAVVRKGNPLADILATTLEQALRGAEAELLAAQAQEANLRVELERYRQMLGKSAVSQQQFDAIDTQYRAARARLEQAEAMLKSARSNLGDARITAPISGIIGKRYVEPGDMALPSQPLLTIVQMDRVKVSFEVTETDLGQIEIGQEAFVEVKSYPHHPFRGKVATISPVLDPLTRMAEVEVLLDNPGHRLKPGMFARVEVRIGVIDNVIVVPRAAVIENTRLQTGGDGEEVIKDYFVFVVDSNRAAQRKLTVQYVNDQHLAIDAGLTVGEQLVTLGQNMLRDSAAVVIVNREGD